MSDASPSFETLYKNCADAEAEWLRRVRHVDTLKEWSQAAAEIAERARAQKTAATEALIEAKATTFADAALKARFVCELTWSGDEPSTMLGNAADHRMIASLLRDLLTASHEGSARG